MLSDPPGWRSPSSISRPVPAPGPRPRGPGPFGRPKKSFLASTDLGDHPNLERRYGWFRPLLGTTDKPVTTARIERWRSSTALCVGARVRPCTLAGAQRICAGRSALALRPRSFIALDHGSTTSTVQCWRRLRRSDRCPPVSWQPWSTAATVAADAKWHCSQTVIAAHALQTTTARALTCCTLSSHSDGPRDHPEACPVYPCGRRALSYSGTR